MRKILIIAALSLIFLSCSWIVNFFSFYPDKRSIIPPEQLPAHVENIYITTDDNKNIQAYHFSNARKHKQLVIYFHGNAGNLTHRMEPATEIYNMGYDVLLVSYRGYANSEGRPSEEGIYLDGKAALNYTEETLKYPSEKIYLFGRSIGSTVAVHIAQGVDLAGVILVSPISSGREVAESQGFGVLKYLAGNPFESVKKINNIKAPLLIIHGTNDEIIPFEHGMNLYNKYNGPKKFIALGGADHNRLHITHQEIYYRSIKEFLNTP